jgi:hypothetical protein
MWSGGVHYGNTIAYRTFIEVVGTPGLWLLKKLPCLGEVSWVTAVTVISIALYGALGLVLGLAIGAIRTPTGAYHRTGATDPT